MANAFKQRITLAVTGASGIQYAMRLLQCLLKSNTQVYLLVSQAAQAVAALETDIKLPGQTDKLQTVLAEQYQAQESQLQVFGANEWSAPIASGSGVADAMVICPCSMGALSAIAVGASDNLIERAADVMLKEKQKLILVTRESPLSSIHLENMLKLSQVGATILPANPGFYHRPKAVDDIVDFVVARILDHLAIEHDLVPRWG